MNPQALKRILAELRRALPVLPALQVDQYGRVVGRHYGANITSVFQPWRRPNGGDMVAVEAYARSSSKQGADRSPWQILADNVVDDDLVTLDRLSRTVHALNYLSIANDGLPLVLNVDARLLEAVPERHGEFFCRVLDLLGIPTTSTVIEIRTVHQFDLTRLRRILASYRKHGFAVALNVEGTIHARALAELLAPDILMLDAPGYMPEELRRLAAGLVGRGPTLAVKRVETRAYADAVLESGADWVQGFFFDQPSAIPATVPSSAAEAVAA